MNGNVPTQGANIFIYSDPRASKANGCIHDGWEVSSEEVLFYTGEGQVGDQKLEHGNRAIFEHVRNSRTLRFFESEETKQRVGKH